MSRGALPLDRQCQLAARFWAKVQKTAGCWLWTAPLTPSGYGQFHAGGRRMMRAHRFSFEVVNGPIPSGAMVCHRCDVRHCVNPDHLFLGTATDNMRDCAQKGRIAAGERHGMVNLSAESVMAIRHEWASGATQIKLARKFGVARSCIAMIVCGGSWSHLPLVARAPEVMRDVKSRAALTGQG